MVGGSKNPVRWKEDRFCILFAGLNLHKERPVYADTDVTVKLVIFCSEHRHKVYGIPRSSLCDACLPQVRETHQRQEVPAPFETVRLSAQAQVQFFERLERLPHEDLNGLKVVTSRASNDRLIAHFLAHQSIGVRAPRDVERVESGLEFVAMATAIGVAWDCHADLDAPLAPRLPRKLDEELDTPC